MIINSLNRLKITLFFSLVIADIDISIINYLLVSILTLYVLKSFVFFMKEGESNSFFIIPNGWQSLIKEIHGLKIQLWLYIVTTRIEKYLPFMVLIFILFNNLIDLVPHSFTVTSYCADEIVNELQIDQLTIVDSSAQARENYFAQALEHNAEHYMAHALENNMHTAEYPSTYRVRPAANPWITSDFQDAVDHLISIRGQVEKCICLPTHLTTDGPTSSIFRRLRRPGAFWRCPEGGYGLSRGFNQFLLFVIREGDRDELKYATNRFLALNPNYRNPLFTESIIRKAYVKNVGIQRLYQYEEFAILINVITDLVIRSV